MKALKRLALEQSEQQNPMIKDIEKEYQKEKEKDSSVLKEARRLGIVAGLGAILTGLGTVDLITKDQVDDAKFLGIGTLGLALLAVSDVRKFKNTVLSAQNRAIVNVIKPYLDEDEKDYVRDFDKSNRDIITKSGIMGGGIAMATSYIAGKTTFGESLTVGTFTVAASILAEEVVRAKDIKENNQFLTNSVRYIIQNKGR